jgi:hypothetical protein
MVCPRVTNLFSLGSPFAVGRLAARLAVFALTATIAVIVVNPINGMSERARTEIREEAIEGFCVAHATSDASIDIGLVRLAACLNSAPDRIFDRFTLTVTRAFRTKNGPCSSSIVGLLVHSCPPAIDRFATLFAVGTFPATVTTIIVDPFEGMLRGGSSTKISVELSKRRAITLTDDDAAQRIISDSCASSFHGSPNGIFGFVSPPVGGLGWLAHTAAFGHAASERSQARPGVIPAIAQTNPSGTHAAGAAIETYSSQESKALAGQIASLRHLFARFQERIHGAPDQLGNADAGFLRQPTERGHFFFG